MVLPTTYNLLPTFLVNALRYRYNSFMSLYHTYRPQDFDDVAGLATTKEVLKNAVKEGKVSHAYLFAGSRGTGKTSCARILAKHILTSGIDDETLKTQIWESVSNGSFVDLIEIDAASNTGVDNIRDLIDKIQFNPNVAKAKVYIIDEVHMLSKGAFNALLKTLEEPPPYAYFILATTELHKVPETIQSRCIRLPFNRHTQQDIINRLQFVADKEGIKVTPEGLEAIAQYSRGGMRDAISLLDQLQTLDNIDDAVVAKHTGGMTSGSLQTMMTALMEDSYEVIVDTLKNAELSGTSFETLTRQLLTGLRTKLYENVKEQLDVQKISSLMKKLLEALPLMRNVPMPGMVLESALLSSESEVLPAQRNVSKVAKVAEVKKEVLDDVEVQEVSTSTTSSTSRTSTTSETSNPAEETESEEVAAVLEASEQDGEPEVKPAASTDGSMRLADVIQVWPEVIAGIDKASARMSLKTAELKAINGEVLTLAFNSDYHKQQVVPASISRQVEDGLQAKLGTKLSIECSVDVAAAPPKAEPFAPPTASRVDAIVNKEAGESVEDMVGDVFG